ncbi:hypothetical protein KIN20_026915 [Parelaphostrongylus tenuis]|uniref:Uncharacterized protein n=1 Tax=Parelaphostrongylus tenuis TaxID=148309 RepID=A0AAD5QYR9_PARTN|nr:hypothetical protein KIN20_026915 [Parelaphostrongylus tenuis]
MVVNALLLTQQSTLVQLDFLELEKVRVNQRVGNVTWNRAPMIWRDGNLTETNLAITTDDPSAPNPIGQLLPCLLGCNWWF